MTDAATLPAASDERCPCGSGDTYGACCERFHAGLAGTGVAGIDAGPHAPSAEALMRSRYSANALLARDPQAMGAYLFETWDPATRPPLAELSEPGPEWVRLQVLETTGGPFDDAATVEFVALYRAEDGSRQRLHERSRFRREAGRWLYIDGEIR